MVQNFSNPSFDSFLQLLDSKYVLEMIVIWSVAKIIWKL